MLMAPQALRSVLLMEDSKRTFSRIGAHQSTSETFNFFNTSL